GVCDGRRVTGRNGRAARRQRSGPTRQRAGFTWCFPVAFDPDGDYVIDRPAQYRRWAEYVPRLSPAWPGRLLDWTHSDPATLAPRQRVLFPREHADPYQSLWLYRRLVCADAYALDARPHEVTLVNWPQNDYFEGNIIDQPTELGA